MASEWYYTTNKQQMGPVTWAELHELAASGILKPHDLVWSEGMDEWVKAIHQKGLFAEGAAEEKVTAKQSSYAEAKPPPGRRSRQEEDDEDIDDEKEAKRRARQQQQQRTKMAVGVKIGLILAGGGVLVVCGLCCLGGLVWFGVGGIGGGKNQSYTVFNMPQRTVNNRQVRFQQGQRITITVTNNLANPNTDVDLLVFRAGNLIALDERVPAQDRHCRVEFVAPATDNYQIQLKNLGPGMANSCVVNITEH